VRVVVVVLVVVVVVVVAVVVVVVVVVGSGSTCFSRLVSWQWCGVWCVGERLGGGVWCVVGRSHRKNEQEKSRDKEFEIADLHRPAAESSRSRGRLLPSAWRTNEGRNAWVRKPHLPVAFLPRGVHVHVLELYVL
jgi:hypothetical protein